MPAPEDSPMHKDLWSRLDQIAKECDNREENGEPLPLLDLHLEGGFLIEKCEMLDGSNSLDDQSIDVTTRRNPAEPDTLWVVPISRIVALKISYPEAKP